jgi:hypothetical protein
MIASLEQQIKDLNNQLVDERSLHDEAKDACHNYKSRISQLESKHEECQRELADLRNRTEKHELDRNKTYTFLDRLVKFYNLPTSSTALFNTDLEKSLDVVMNRIQEAISTSSASRAQSAELDKRTHEKKITALKEQLSNKEIHLSLMRKKMAEYEEKDTDLNAINTQVAAAKSSNRKAEKLAEEVAQLKSENVTLKAKVFDMEKIIVNKNSDSLLCWVINFNQRCIMQ